MVEDLEGELLAMLIINKRQAGLKLSPFENLCFENGSTADRTVRDVVIKLISDGLENRLLSVIESLLSFAYPESRRRCTQVAKIRPDALGIDKEDSLTALEGMRYPIREDDLTTVKKDANIVNFIGECVVNAFNNSDISRGGTHGRASLVFFSGGASEKTKVVPGLVK
ncbi:hypothetical protein Tco_0631568, partial [Tanacetum coccineum]